MKKAGVREGRAGGRPISAERRHNSPAMRAAAAQLVRRAVAARPTTRRPARMAATAASGADFPGRTVKVSHVLLPPGSADLLDAIQASVEAGEASLADAAKEHSTCPSATAGGSLGWIERGATVPEFEAAAMDCPVGGLARATTGFGEHLLSVEADRAGTPTVSQAGVTDLAEALANPPPGAQFVDVREEGELDTASIDRARFVHLPLSRFAEWAPSVATTLDPTAPTYVLCHAGMRSMRVATHLVGSAGFGKVFNVSGGIDAYSRLVDPNVPRY